MADTYERIYRINNGEDTGLGKANELVVSIYYNLGGINYFTYKNEPRGYYFSITPQCRKGNMVSYAAFSGSKMLALPVSRKSIKSFIKAKGMFQTLFDQYVEAFCEQKGYSIDKDSFVESER